jgi:hypothetical protein
MKRLQRRFLAMAAGLLALATPAAAHHGDSGRYEDKLTTVSGTVVEVQLVNPHSVLIVDVTDASGKVVRWRGELGSAVSLKQIGWTRTTLKPGDAVTMTGRRLKNGSPAMTLSEGARVLDGSGKELYRGNDPAPAPR